MDWYPRHAAGLLVLLVLAGLAVPGWAAAQEPPAEDPPAKDPPLHIFASVGLGPGAGPTVGLSGGSIAVSSSVTFNHGVHDFVLRATAVGAVGEYGPTVGEIAVLYGRRMVPDNGLIRVAGGLAGQVDLVLAPSPFFGIGFGLIANINVEQPALGTLVTLHLGQLR